MDWGAVQMPGKCLREEYLHGNRSDFLILDDLSACAAVRMKPTIIAYTAASIWSFPTAVAT
jgi:hypothetical protein